MNFVSYINAFGQYCFDNNLTGYRKSSCNIGNSLKYFDYNKQICIYDIICNILSPIPLFDGHNTF